MRASSILFLTAASVCATSVLPLTPGERKSAQDPQAADRRPGIPLDHSEQPYGFLFIKGAPAKMEYFRANFGGLIPCGSRQLAWMPDRLGCSLVEEPVVSARFAVALRGECTFATKAAYAQKAGAHALIIVNTDGGLLRMPLGNRSTNEDNAIYLPTVMVRQAFEGIMDSAVRGKTNVTGALRPFRDACIPDDAFVPHQRIRARISPSSRSVVASGKRSPFVIDPPGNTDWKPRLASSGQLRLFSAQPEWNPHALQSLSVDVSAEGQIQAAAEAEGREPQSPWGLEVALQEEMTLATFGAPTVPRPMPLTLAQPLDACSNLTNMADHLYGSVVVVTRGICPMVEKARLAQQAKAAAMIIVNNDATTALLRAYDEALGELSSVIASATSSKAIREASEQDPEAGPSVDSGALPDQVQQAHARYSSAIPPAEQIGLVQPVPDDHPENVHIPVVVVGSDVGKAIMDTIRASPHGLESEQYDPVEDAQSRAWVSLQTDDARQAGPAWDAIRALLMDGSSSWPSSSIETVRKMVQLLRENHPRSAAGSEARMSALRAATLATGVIPASKLHTLEQEVMFSPDGTAVTHWSDGEATKSTAARITSAEPATAFLLGGMPVAAMALSQGDSLGCSVEGQTAHVRIAPRDAARSAGHAVMPRLAEVLKYQACLEKLLLHNTAAVGKLFELLQSESSSQDFVLRTHGLLRRFGSRTKDESVAMAARYVGASHAIGRAAAAAKSPAAVADEAELDNEGRLPRQDPSEARATTLAKVLSDDQATL